MSSINFGNPDLWMLFGTTSVMTTLIEKLLAEKQNILVVCGDRHLQDEIKPQIKLINYLKDRDIPFLVSDDVNNDPLVTCQVTLQTIGISFDAPWIFKKSFINLFNGKLINSHGARLPQDRGGGGISWRILQGERLGYSVLHQVIPKVDAGPIVKIEQYFYPSECKVPADYFAYSVKKDNLFIETFADEVLQGKDFNLIGQPEYLSIYWPRLHTDTHGFINWDWSLPQIESFICAFGDPYNGASTYFHDERVWLKSALISYKDGTFHPFQAGVIYRKTDDALFIATEQGTLVIQEVLTANKLDIKHRIKVGDRFNTPLEYLQAAKDYRAVYTAAGLSK